MLSFEYDANRTALVSLVAYTNGLFCYTLSSNPLIASAVLNSNTLASYENRLGYCANLNFIRPGILLNSIEILPLAGAKYTRAGSMSAKLVSTADGYSIVKLRSRFLLRITNLCVGVVGVLLSRLNFVNSTFNAGWRRRLGWRPCVRGVAMNPIDHPHGGGQGKTSGGRPSVTP